ncbi:MAG TPA: LysM peptidoglycan-binding domain-containing protein [Solirubrobacteraceae bacterium]|jgi:soluble lytic murein transglycosylase-like protein|nr:LysM peptidoglycan-binding domain-containing protein [Solirubrobacteraceae bacterium]
MPGLRPTFLCLAAALAALILAAPAGAAVHVVAPGESLTSVAAADGLSIAQLAAANGLDLGAQLISGQTLVIPSQTASAVWSAGTAAATQPASANEGSYVVQPGDTLTAIAERAGSTVASLAAVNGIDPSQYLVSGTVLSLNGIAATGAATGVAGPATTGSAAGTGRPPYPTAEVIGSSEVGSIAASQGVPPSLAAAIGWQESGFNNAEVSHTGAVGVMQIEPGTWAWIQQNLAAGALAPASAHDNVLGGVLLLHQLLADAHGDPALAAAGYYQGLASVLKSGMYPSTRHYVNDVLALQSQFGGQ